MIKRKIKLTKKERIQNIIFLYKLKREIISLEHSIKSLAKNTDIDTSLLEKKLAIKIDNYNILMR